MKFIYTLMLLSLGLQSVSSQSIMFSFDVDSSNPSMVEVQIFARSSGADENLSGYTSVFYYNSADVDWLSYDQAPAQALGWVTNDFTTREEPAANVSVPIVHNTRLELQQFDGNFNGSTISSEPIHVGTLFFTIISAGKGFLAPGDVFISNVSIDPGIQYVNNAFTGFDIATEGTTSRNLPVDLTFFKAEKDLKFSNISWQTASEVENDFFNIERSADGVSFETIGQVKGFGTTSETQNYDFLDRTPHAGLNYYRLKQVDYNGEYEYSKVETVDFRDGTEGDVAIFPNPAFDYVNVTLDRAYDGVKVINQLGQLVESLPSSQYESNQFKLDLSAYAPGVYFLEAKLGHEIVNKQFVKVK